MTLYSVNRGQWVDGLFRITPFCREWRWCVNSFRPSVTYICDNELCHYWFTDDGLSPIRCQACNETMIYCQLGTHSENSSTIMHLKKSFTKYRSFFRHQCRKGSHAIYRHDQIAGRWCNHNSVINSSPLVPHIRIRNLYCLYASVARVNIGSDNSLSPIRRQAII